jgi:hypothetical protein
MYTLQFCLKLDYIFQKIVYQTTENYFRERRWICTMVRHRWSSFDNRRARCSARFDNTWMLAHVYNFCTTSMYNGSVFFLEQNHTTKHSWNQLGVDVRIIRLRSCTCTECCWALQWTVAMQRSKAEARNTVSVCYNPVQRIFPINSFVLGKESDNDSNSLVRSVSLYTLSAPFAGIFSLNDILSSINPTTL